MPIKRETSQQVKPRKRLTKAEALQQAMTLLQGEGFIVKPPNLQEEDRLKEEAGVVLGDTKVIQQRKRKEAAKPVSKVQHFNLYFAHSINGRRYGPGMVETEDITLMHTLLNQDRMAQHQQQRDFEPFTRCNLVVQRQNTEGRTECVGLRVDPSLFQSPELNIPPELLNGQNRVTGYFNFEQNNIGSNQSYVQSYNGMYGEQPVQRVIRV